MCLGLHVGLTGSGLETGKEYPQKRSLFLFIFFISCGKSFSF